MPDDLTDHIAHNDDAIRTDSFRALLGRYGDPDTLYRIADRRIDAFATRTDTERVKLLTAWLDGYTAAARKYTHDRPI